MFTPVHYRSVRVLFIPSKQQQGKSGCVPGSALFSYIANSFYFTILPEWNKDK